MSRYCSYRRAASTYKFDGRTPRRHVLGQVAHQNTSTTITPITPEHRKGLFISPLKVQYTIIPVLLVMPAIVPTQQSWDILLIQSAVMVCEEIFTPTEFPRKTTIKDCTAAQRWCVVRRCLLKTSRAPSALSAHFWLDTPSHTT